MAGKSLTLPFFAEELKTNLSERLKRIEGQVRGVEKMLQDNQPCPKVLQQMSATIAALNGVSAIVLRNYLESCVTAAVESGDGQRKKVVFDELVEVIKRFGQ
jgi:CsoR family transcriptional regulator, copper-sensing transcriptional repressor